MNQKSSYPYQQGFLTMPIYHRSLWLLASNIHEVCVLSPTQELYDTEWEGEKNIYKHSSKLANSKEDLLPHFGSGDFSPVPLVVFLPPYKPYVVSFKPYIVVPNLQILS